MSSKIHSLYCGAKFFQGLLISKFLKKNIPLYVLIHVNNRCNLRCKYCYSNPDNRFDKNIRDFTTEEIKSLILELKSMGTRWISFLGGEPLLREDIGELINYTNKKGMLTELTTNGVLVKQKIDEIFKLDMICFSIDGNEKANDSIRGKGTYKKIIEGIKAAKERKMNIRLSATITRASMNSLKELAKLAKELGVCVGYSQVHRYPPQVEQLMRITKEEYKKIWVEAKKLKEEGYPVYNGNKILEYVIKWASLGYTKTYGNKKEFISDFKPIPCYMGRRMCYVDSEGFVYPCIQLGIKNGLNFIEVGFKKAWEHIAKHDECEYCGMLQYIECNHLFHLNPDMVLMGIKYLLHK